LFTIIFSIINQQALVENEWEKNMRINLNTIIIKLYSFLPLKIQRSWKRIEDSDIGNRIAKGAFWSLTGSVVSQGLILLASIVVARILGKTEYGEFGMIRSTINMFTVFAGFGLGITATKFIAEFRIKDKIKTERIIGLTTIFAAITGGIISITILITALFLAEKTINAPQLVNEIRLGAVMIFFSSLNGAYTGTLAGFESFKTIAKVNLISGILAFPIQIGFTLLFGLPGSVIGIGINYLILWLLNLMSVRQVCHKFGFKFQIKGSWNEWPVLYKFSLPALLSGILVSPVMWACNAMLVNHPNGYGEMAIFDAANQWRNTILFIPAILSQIVLPLLSSSTSNYHQFNKILKINIVINFLIVFIMAVVISLFSGIIMRSYGEGFAEGKLVLIILSFSTIFISINNVIGQAIAGKNKMWIGFAINILWGAILLFTTKFFLDKGMGALGLAFGYVISYTIHTGLQFSLLKGYILTKNY
jgi:O-antigen/teichoic acid export membrane protein